MSCGPGRVPYLALALAASLPGMAAIADMEPGAADTEPGRIIDAALASDRAYERLRYLSDRIGARPAGTKAYDRAAQWARMELEKDGADRAVLEKVRVPHWIRGRESAALVSPERRALHILGLGGSVATRPGGTLAPVVVVDSFETLDTVGAGAKGKIVLFDAAMPTDIDPFEAYGRVYPFRGSGASRAAKHGAVAVLVRSLTTRSLQTPHTGKLSYQADVPRIPAAAVTVEDALLLRRMYDAGEAPTCAVEDAGPHPEEPALRQRGRGDHR